MSNRIFIYSESLLILFVAGIGFQPSKCDVHTYGAFPQSISFFEAELFNRNMSESNSKDYALFFKYRAPSMDGMIGYIELNSTAESTGSISANHDMDFKTERIIEANANIRNAYNFNVGIKIKGFHGIDLSRMTFLIDVKKFIKPRSFAIMCGAVPNQRRQKYRTFEFGKRVDGDFLVRFERHLVVTKASQFPSHNFNFFDGAINISYVKLTIDSPTAIVFSNKIALEKYKFVANIYGTDRSTLTTEMWIYGTKL